jgi:hypothetical protein
MGNFQEASDLESSVSISPRRFEESPFIERTYCPGMIRGVYAGRYFPISLGEDHIEKCGMVTLIKSSSWRPGLNSLVNILAGGVGLNLREVYRANL